MLMKFEIIYIYKYLLGKLMICQSKVEATFLDNPAVSFFQPSKKRGDHSRKRKGKKTTRHVHLLAIGNKPFLASGFFSA